MILGIIDHIDHWIVLLTYQLGEIFDMELLFNKSLSDQTTFAVGIVPTQQLYWKS